MSQLLIIAAEAVNAVVTAREMEKKLRRQSKSLIIRL